MDIREMTVNDILAKFPETISIFNEFGIDACCGGGAALTDAAKRDGADIEKIVTALTDRIGAARI
ncbi:MAG: DUF542 domain-containing protein [Nitrospirota bacterium]